MRVLVSLTSTRVRLPILKYTLISLLDQNCPPDEIVLNLSSEPYLFDEGIESLPDWLKNIDSTKVTINWVPNEGPYRKLIPTIGMAQFDDLIVTCDDDVIYGPEWLGVLLRFARENPDCIICGRARRPVKNFFGLTQSYNNWIFCDEGSRSLKSLPIGIAGVVYRKSLLDSDLLNSKYYLKYAPKQDDLWFKLSSYRMDTYVFVAPGVNQQIFAIDAPAKLYDINAKQAWKFSKGQVLMTFIERLIYFSKCYFGISVTENDRVWKLISKKFSKVGIR
ncbi:glycosyltransferase family A protein [Marinobacter sp. CA1]|uniref:glycosyltransferase family A protein n=1 Tax=Marinobacter sp. CA1 TaxID=2817656 RepID=UPI001D098CDA|nr:glycosyltransferase family A protein [Marinobacter sp. CA1]UDL03853.1 glycosyltransferase family 2 protein [Marinobacter sp. CA1]